MNIHKLIIYYISYYFVDDFLLYVSDYTKILNNCIIIKLIIR